MIDGHKLIMSLNDWWYSSFGYEETEESKAIKKVINEVEKYVEQAEQTEPQTCDTCKHYNPHHEAIACERCLDGKYNRYEPEVDCSWK